jgi:hypothetical protein
MLGMRWAPNHPEELNDVDLMSLETKEKTAAVGVGETNANEDEEVENETEEPK